MMEQGTPEWFAARCGKVTASKIADVMAKIKTGEAATRKNYRTQLIVERLTGLPAESFSNAAMQRGTELEPIARAAYETAAGVMVDQIGFVDHPVISMSGASPDGLVNHDGLVEIKCPNTTTHIENLLRGKADPTYIPQMQWQMACTGREWCDFVSYDDRMPVDLQLVIHRVHRDPSLILDMEAEVGLFLEQVDQDVNQLLALRAA